MLGGRCLGERGPHSDNPVYQDLAGLPVPGWELTQSTFGPKVLA
jgi:hypothetical protein